MNPADVVVAPFFHPLVHPTSVPPRGWWVASCSCVRPRMVPAAAAASWPPSANHEAMTAAMHQSSPPSWDIPTLTQQNHHQSTVFSACQNNNWTAHCFMTNETCIEGLWEWQILFAQRIKIKDTFCMFCIVDDVRKSCLQDQKAKILNLDFL